MRWFSDLYFGNKPNTQLPMVKPTRPPPCGPVHIARHKTPMQRIDAGLKIIARELRATDIDPAKEELRKEFDQFRDSVEKYRLIKIIQGKE